MRTETQAMLASLSREKTLLITPKGLSMWPLFTGRRDNILLERCEYPLRKGDVALFLGSEDALILHRVTALKDGVYTFQGDALTTKETGVSAEHVYAVMRGFYRKGKYVDVRSPLYRLYCVIWCHAPLRWFRRPLLCLGTAICKGRTHSHGRGNGGTRQ